MKDKIVVSAVSIILVVGVVIGVVTGVRKHGFGAKNQEDLSPQTKAITSICSPTEYKDLCVQSLSKTAPNGTTDPKELIHAAVLATINSLKDSRTFTTTINSTKPLIQMAIEDCTEMLELAMERVEAALSSIKESDIYAVSDRVPDLQTWVGSVLAHYTSCLQGFEENETDKDYMPEMEKNLQDPKQLAVNALAILEELSSVLSAFGIKLNKNPSSRRLLTSDNYPTWFSRADRKLLAQADIGKIEPDAVVAQDGKSGHFSTIKDALKAYPKNLGGRRYIIYVKAGIYKEKVTINEKSPNVFMYGDGPMETKITFHKNKVGLIKKFGEHDKDRTTTWRTATFSVRSPGFLCMSMGFENSAGPLGHQAVALHSQSDKSAFLKCGFYGFQDTLYVHSERQFYRDCDISGTVDFIFGDAACIVQNSRIEVRVPLPSQYNVIVAQAKDKKVGKTGIVIQDCIIVPSHDLLSLDKKDRIVKTYLARPWKRFATTVFMESDLGDFIVPEGYIPWDSPPHTGDYFAEYNNRGASADVRGRVKWPSFKGIISRGEALKWTASSFLGANTWLRGTNGLQIPYNSGLKPEKL